jgi:hypothetical protein
VFDHEQVASGGGLQLRDDDGPAPHPEPGVRRSASHFDVISLGLHHHVTHGIGYDVIVAPYRRQLALRLPAVTPAMACPHPLRPKCAFRARLLAEREEL